MRAGVSYRIVSVNFTIMKTTKIVKIMRRSKMSTPQEIEIRKHLETLRDIKDLYGEPPYCSSRNRKQVEALTFFIGVGEKLEVFKKLTGAVRDYADIGNKQFNQDETEFWKMCEVNDEVEAILNELGGGE